MNRLADERRVQILGMLCEGSSMRSIARLADVSVNTVTRELVVSGQACTALHDRLVRNVTTRRVQADEIWSFVGMKERSAKAKGPERDVGTGDVWTWTGIDADSKLIISWFVGGRDAGAAYEFMEHLAGRLKNRVQLTTDGHRPYLEAVDAHFADQIHYAQLVKLYGADPRKDQRRYSPRQCIGARSKPVSGDPDPDHISTSFVERQNLTMRMSMRRFTRLTNAFSKKLANHCHMLAIYTVWHNSCRIHKTLRVTPAMEAGLTDRLWSLEDVIRATDEWEARQPRKKVGRKPKKESN